MSHHHLRYAIDTVGADAEADKSAVIVATASVTIKLPKADHHRFGVAYFIKNASTGAVTIAAAAGDNIDGQPSLALSSQYDVALVVSTGNNTWSILAAN